MNKDLTSGKPSSVLWKFCLPLFGSIIFQQLYNIADSFVAGKFIGNDALAAVGNSYEITLIFIAFAFGCNIGCSVVVSNFFGAKKYGEMKTSVYTSLIAGGVLRGSGMMKQFMIATFTDLILRVVLAEVLALTPLGTTGIWTAWPCGWCVSAALSIIFYRGGAWNKMPDAENKEEEIVREEEELEEETEGDGL